MPPHGILAALATGAMLCGTASGAEPAYRFTEFAFVKAAHGNGGGIRGSGALGDLLLVQGSVEGYGYLDGGVAMASLGIGARWPLASSIMVSCGLSAEFVGGAFEMDDDRGIDGGAMGYGAGAELRGRIGEWLELQASARFVFMAEDSSRLVASVGMRHYLAPRLAAGLDVTDDYFGTRLGLVLRYDFSGN